MTHYPFMPADSAATRLCMACGLCCNGVLFDIVCLQPQDAMKTLEKLGMKVNRRKTEPYFKQPCGFLHDRCCGIYDRRPVRCRHFECRILRRLDAGEFSEEQASSLIQQALRMVEEIEQRLEKLGGQDMQATLGSRVGQALEARPDPTLQDQLRRLQLLLDREFRVASV
jgi:Fe-S-cluster containining protein